MTAADNLAALRRRREASRRLPPLACGCVDPWTCRCDDPPPSEKMLDAATDAAEHLMLLGFAPVFGLATVRAMW